MIKVFIPQSKGRVKTDVRDFWQSDNGKVYYDYLKVCTRFFVEDSDIIRCLADYKKRYRQEAIAYIDNNVLKIFYDVKNSIDTLPNRIYREVLRHDLKRSIKEALNRFKGCTVYIVKGKYYIEIFYK